MCIACVPDVAGAFASVKPCASADAQGQHSKKLRPADRPTGVFPSQSASAAVVRKSCCGGSPTLGPESLVLCAGAAKPQASARSAQADPPWRLAKVVLIRATPANCVRLAPDIVPK